MENKSGLIPRSYRRMAAACLLGILLFVTLYVIAAFQYPGGTDQDKLSKGFNWVHNYWCELLATNAKSGAPNGSRPVAMLAFVILDLTLLCCWIQAGYLFTRRTVAWYILLVSGTVSSLILFFLSTAGHDQVINLAGGFGITALVTTLTGLYRERFWLPFWLGIICVLLFFVNSLVYYTGFFIGALAVIQKISFALFLYWFWMISRIYLQKNHQAIR